MSGGGGKILASGCLPFLTMNVIPIPQLMWRSKWQCINHTPAENKRKKTNQTQSILPQAQNRSSHTSNITMS